MNELNIPETVKNVSIYQGGNNYNSTGLQKWGRWLATGPAMPYKMYWEGAIGCCKGTGWRKGCDLDKPLAILSKNAGDWKRCEETLHTILELFVKAGLLPNRIYWVKGKFWIFGM